MSRMTEDTLVQQTAAEYLRDHLGWKLVYADNEGDFTAIAAGQEWSCDSLLLQLTSEEVAE